MVKLTKNELKKQKDSLKRFMRYLPTLKLKQQQLQSVLQKIQLEIRKLREEYDQYYKSIQAWIAVFADVQVRDLESYITKFDLELETQSIAGVDIPVFKKLHCKVKQYNLIATPWWVDDGLEALINVLSLGAQIEIFEQQYSLISRELQTTIQRVNLFEKVKIPETKHNIRVIQIYLGDQQTASVVRGKLTKSRIMEAAA